VPETQPAARLADERGEHGVAERDDRDLAGAEQQAPAFGGARVVVDVGEQTAAG
jgi:hypothetical protein